MSAEELNSAFESIQILDDIGTSTFEKCMAQLAGRVEVGMAIETNSDLTEEERKRARWKLNATVPDPLSPFNS
jgi:hypothetical protein